MFNNFFNSFLHIAIRVAPFILICNYFRLGLYDHYEYKQFIMNLSYNVIYFYSRAQIALGKTVTNTKQLINSQPLLKNICDNAYNIYNNFKKKIDKLEYIKDYEIVGKYPIDYLYSHPIQYDFIIASYYNNDNDNIYNRIFYSYDDISREYDPSNLHFMLIEFYIGEQCFLINLNNTSHNYYVVDNKINIQFILYYVYINYPGNLTKEQLNKTDELINKCCIRILDQSVNIIEISKYEDYILLKKDEYETHRS
jgi:hypothetical protein